MANRTDMPLIPPKNRQNLLKPYSSIIIPPNGVTPLKLAFMSAIQINEMDMMQCVVTILYLKPLRMPFLRWMVEQYMEYKATRQQALEKNGIPIELWELMDEYWMLPSLYT
jgi:hypothetical protein